METQVIEQTVRVAAAPETVYTFLTQPELFMRWMGERVWLDPRPGGEFRVRYDDANVVSGVFLEVEAACRVVFSWGWEGSDAVRPGSSRVAITLTPDGADTLLRLVHTQLPDDAVRDHHVGWERFLSRLPDVVAMSIA